MIVVALEELHYGNYQYFNGTTRETNTWQLHHASRKCLEEQACQMGRGALNRRKWPDGETEAFPSLLVLFAVNVKYVSEE